MFVDSVLMMHMLNDPSKLKQQIKDFFKIEKTPTCHVWVIFIIRSYRAHRGTCKSKTKHLVCSFDMMSPNEMFRGNGLIARDRNIKTKTTFPVTKQHFEGTKSYFESTKSYVKGTQIIFPVFSFYL